MKKWKSNFLKFWQITLCCFLLSACYTMDVEQGNVIDPKVLSQIKVGMSKAEVTNLLGTSLIKDYQDSEHLVYVYTNQKNGGKIHKTKLDLYFSHDFLSLSRVTTSVE